MKSSSGSCERPGDALSLAHPWLHAIRVALRRLPAGGLRDLLIGPVTSYLLPDGYRLAVALPNGTRLYGGPLDIVTRMILWFGDCRTGCWEPYTSKLAVALSRHGSTVIVGGAHVGVFVIQLARSLTASGGSVVALNLPTPSTRNCCATWLSTVRPT